MAGCDSGVDIAGILRRSDDWTIRVDHRSRRERRAIVVSAPFRRPTPGDPTTMRLADFSTLTFDCYGTLIDWESGMYAALQPLWSRASGKPSREAVLELHARYESAQQLQTPTMRYSQLLAIVYKRLAEALGVAASWSECEAYGRAIRNWPAFPDSAEALAYLKNHYKLVILSNVDNESFSVSNARLGVTFDAILTAEDIGAY